MEKWVNLQYDLEYIKANIDLMDKTQLSATNGILVKNIMQAYYKIKMENSGGEKQQQCDSGLNLCGVTNSNLTVKIDDTTAFGCPHHNHNKHRVYIDGLSHKEALLIQKIVTNLLR